MPPILRAASLRPQDNFSIVCRQGPIVMMSVSWVAMVCPGSVLHASELLRTKQTAKCISVPKGTSCHVMSSCDLHDWYARAAVLACPSYAYVLLRTGMHVTEIDDDLTCHAISLAL